MKKLRLDIKKQDLINQIQNCTSKKQIQEHFNLTLYELNNLLNYYNLEAHSAKHIKGISKYDFITKEWLEENWLNTDKTINDLSKEFKIPVQALEKQYIKFNVHKPFKYHIKINNLYNIADYNVWYFAGLVVTDGYLTYNQNSIELDLTGESELILLQQLQEYFGGSLIKLKKSNRLRIAAMGLNQFFETNFNIKSGSKTYIADIPEYFPDENCAKAYIRGCMDGDGYISKTGNNWSLLTASEKLVLGIQNIYYKYTGITIPVSYQGRKNTINKYPVIGATDKKARDFLTWIYSVNCFKLNRKYQNYLNYYKNVDDIV